VTDTRILERKINENNEIIDLPEDEERKETVCVLEDSVSMELLLTAVEENGLLENNELEEDTFSSREDDRVVDVVLGIELDVVELSGTESEEVVDNELAVDDELSVDDEIDVDEELVRDDELDVNDELAVDDEPTEEEIEDDDRLDDDDDEAI
jgi:hypothetical protein